MSELFDRLSKLSPKRLALLALELQEKVVALEEERDASRSADAQPIAIVGMGCRLPGADSPDAYWRLLVEGVDAIREIPASRWDADEYYDPDPDAPGKLATRWGGFLDDVDRFEPQLFGISPREAQSLDPQQRLLLEVAWEALENAGMAPDSLHGTSTGVYVGVCNADYFQLLMDGDGEDFDMYLSTGNAASVASGRVSYVLGLNGPALTVDTACSSSMVAVHLAVQGLRTGACRAALAGGVNVVLSPKTTMTLSRAKMMAADGRCKAFDVRADGFVRGEGCGLVVLKRLADAVADGDRVLAVIRGSAVNQDGRSNGLTAPNGPSQVSVIRAAVADAGIEPADVSYVETHGTGTSLGDPIEAQALGAALGRDRGPGNRLMIGSAKTNLGHLESAAGIAGLLKVVLSLQHGEIPPLLHLTEPNPYIPWDELPIDIPTQRTAWEPRDGRRIAGVSSFGFSGTNAHVVVESAPPPAERATTPDRPRHVLKLSGRTESAVRAQAARLVVHLESQPGVDLSDVAYTANTGRSDLANRSAVVASDVEEARTVLAGVADGSVAASTAGPRERTPEVAFLFTGHGSQYPGMGRSLFAGQPVFREAIERCASLLTPLMDRSLLDVLDVSGEQPGERLLDSMAYAQPALFAIEYALAELWRAWGVRPGAVAGHSVGEYVAAVVAGAISLEDGLRLVAARGRLMASLPPDGEMATVFASEDQVRRALAPHGGRVSIAAINGPQSIALSGTGGMLTVVLDELRAEGIEVRPLAIPIAAHSPQVDPILDAFEEVAATVEYRPPALDVVSGMTGRVAEGDDLTTAGYWRRHLREPVRFADAFSTIHAQGKRIFVEIGPHPALLSMGRHIVPERECTWLPSLRSGRDEWEQILDSVAQLYACGVDIDWRGFDAPYDRRTVSLPTYPFEREHYWVDGAGRRSARRPSGGHPLLGDRVLSPVLQEVVFENHLSATWPAFLDHHRVYGTALVPSPAYIEMALAAADQVLGPGPFALEDLGIREALILPEEGERPVQLVLRTEEGGGSFEVFSRAGEAWALHATGRLRVQPAAPTAPAFTPEEIRARCPDHIDGAAYYAALAELGLEFGLGFRGVAEVWRRDGEALGRVVLPEVLAHDASTYRLHPALLDACFHVLGAPMPTSDAQHAYLLIGMEQFRLLAPSGRTIGRLWNHTVLRPGYEEQGSTFVGDVRLYDEDGTLVAEALGLQLKHASRDALLRATQQLTGEWLYEVAWQQQELPAPTDADAIELAGLSSDLDDRVPVLAEEHGLEGYRPLLDGLERLARSYVVRAFQTLGSELESGQRATTTELADQLGVVPRHRRLLDRLLGVLAAEGLIRGDPSGWEVLPPAGSADANVEAEADDLRARFPGAEVALVERCGENLVAALRGSVEPLELLFPGGSQEETERIYRDTPVARVVNTLAGEALAAVVQARPTDRPVRVLEIGGGTGATTVSALRALPEGAEYWFTDISPVFTSRAEERFGDEPVLRYRTLDIERDPAAQGFVPGHFDVVIAANVLHATADLRDAVTHARDLLAPGGVLLLVEGMRASTWVDITFGLTEGWWRFADKELRPDHPLLDRHGWSELLASTGFDEVAVLSGGADLAGQAVLAATVPSDPAGEGEPGGWVVLADEAGVGACLVEQLGPQSSVLVPADAMLTPEVLLNALADLPEGRRRLVYLRTLDVPALETMSLDQLAASEARAVGGALLTAQALVGVPGTAELWLVTRGAQPAGAIDADPGQAPLWGFGRVVALEHPEIWGGLIDLAPGGSFDVDASTIRDEVLRSDGEDQVARRAEGRFVPRLVRSTAVRPPEAVALKADGSYLVTGGLGGLGLRLARWMAERGAGSVVLLGRRGLPDRERWTTLESGGREAAQVEAIREIEATGCDVTVVAADVADPDAMQALLSRFDGDLPPLRGVVHAAAALSNWTVAAMPQAALEEMLTPKVRGTWLLHQLTADLPLDFFVLFSSTTALWGSRELAHYAAANQFLDAFAHHRHALGLPALSVNWGTWDEMRVASAEERDVVARSGLNAMPSDQALQVLGDLVGRPDIAQLTVASVDWPLLKSIYEVRRARPFLSLVGPRATARPAAAAPAVPVLAAQLAIADEAQRRELVVDFLRDEVARALGIQPAHSVDTQQGLFEMGMDSLMSVELKGRIEVAVGADLPSTLTFNYPNIDALADFLTTEVLAVPSELEDEAPAADQGEAPAALSSVLDDDLTEDDLAALLTERLAKLQ